MQGKCSGINPEQIERAKEHLMEDVLELKGIKLYMGRCRCPVHDGKNKSSFAVKNNSGLCHSCGWHGDSIELYRKLFNVDFVTAVKELAA